MRSRENQQKRIDLRDDFDPDVDRYPDLNAVLNAISAKEDMVTGPVERVEVFCYASGEASFRVWGARAEEPVIGTENLS
jgi:hypothetical protein